MRYLIMIGGLLAAASPALACVCSPPETDAQKSEIAERIARTSVAVADVEQESGMDWESMRGETYRVVKIHVGEAPARFELARSFSRGPDGKVQMGMTSCDEIPPPGRPTTVILYSTDMPGKLRIGGTCDHMFVNMPGGIEAVRAAVRQSGERG
ncbi:MAG TPA: hypothetical protein VFK50_04400 [Sphingomicrobium sp.]|nr:hypothetical protein [Sphingomicrobium sp.]